MSWADFFADDILCKRNRRLERHLLICDDREIGKQVGASLSMIGYAFDEVLSDIDLVDQAARRDYQLVLCCIQLKERSGFEVLAPMALKHPDIPILMIANQMPPNLAAEIQKIGAVDFIPLPIDHNRVVVSLANAMALKKALAGKGRPSGGKADCRSEIETLTQSLKIARKQVIHSEKMAMVGQLTAGVAHEINNPVGFVSSNLNTLSHYQKKMMAMTRQYRALLRELQGDDIHLKRAPGLEKRIKKIERLTVVFDLDFVCRDTLDLIRESLIGISRVKKIVRDLKTFVHPGQDKPESTDIHNLLDSTLNLVWHKLKYSIAIEKDYGKLPKIQCWVGEINQVLLNLVVNAVQAISGKGTISIKTRAVNNNWIEVSIRDSGCGISEEHRKKIFEPFFTTKPVGHGTGLGLHMSHDIIEKHQGTISFDSHIGIGTTFKIRLPIHFKQQDDQEDTLKRG